MSSSVIANRFEELKVELEAVIASEHLLNVVGTPQMYVDNHLFEKWCTKVRALLRQLAGAGAPQYVESFEKQSKARMVGTTNSMLLRDLSAVFLAAKEDCDGGWLTPLNALVRAEVFDDELEQAEELRSKGYSVPAAVIGRVVLETALKSLCARHTLSTGKLAKMNDDLKRANAYDAVVHKRVTFLSAVGNSAAHGLSDFTPDDVEGMLNDIRRFLEDHKP